MNFWIALVVALAVSAIGFKRYIWFISIGYGFSIAALGLACLIGFPNALNPLNVLLCVLLIVYGSRLGAYLASREIRSASYNKVLSKETTQNDDVSLGVRFAIWIAAALLYACMITPVLYRMQNGAAPNVAGWIGLIVLACGIVIEAASDIQKQNAKKVNPHRVVTTGLYSLVRCPNYLGELIAWTGVLISGIGALQGPLQWALAIIGWIGIVYVMFSGARRLEERQNRNYANDPEYQHYHDTVPIMIPFVPLYSVVHLTWLRG